ncbi:MAG: hypothetical protein C4532_06525, partial [Candidatus Abyssobacteria bacterium SURF_17]
MTDAVDGFPPSPDGARPPRPRTLTLAVMLAAIVCIVFANTLLNGFVFDDVSMIRENPAIRDARYVKSYFTRPFFSVGQPVTGPVAYDYYRPLVLLSYLGDHLVWRGLPWGYHLTNVLLHTGVTVLVFLLLTRLRLSDGAAFIGAVLFAVHPALVDSVAGVSGRSDPLCALFFLVSA